MNLVFFNATQRYSVKYHYFKSNMTDIFSYSHCSEVDENPDYDNLDILNRDAEERYFDDDGDDEEEAMSQ